MLYMRIFIIMQPFECVNYHGRKYCYVIFSIDRRAAFSSARQIDYKPIERKPVYRNNTLNYTYT